MGQIHYSRRHQLRLDPQHDHGFMTYRDCVFGLGLNETEFFLITMPSTAIDVL